MDRTLDFYDDHDLELLQGEDVPDYVKEANIRPRHDHDRFGIELITKEGGRKLFPLSDPATTWLSGRYFESSQNEFSKSAQKKIATRIKQAAERFGVDAKDWSFIETADSQSKTASAPSMSKDVALADKEESGSVKTASEYLFPERQRYPVDTTEQVKTAESYFQKHAVEMPPKRRKMFSKRLVKRANELGVEIEDPSIQKYASDNKAEDADIKLAFEARKEYVDNEKVASKLDELYDAREQLPAPVLSEALTEFDKRAGIDGHWNSKFPDPYKSVQGNIDGSLEKSAAETVTYQGIQITPDAIQSIDDSTLKQHFDEEQVRELKNNPVTVFESLPSTHKEIVAGLVQ